MSFVSVAGILLIISSFAGALQCHQVSQLRLTDPITSTATECLTVSLTCLKSVDMTTGLYSKSCGYSNCTSPQGAGNLPAQCFNTSQQTGRESYSCCCYGNGCNAAPEYNVWGVMSGSLIFILASKFFI